MNVPGLVGHEAIDEVAARRDQRLRNAANAVHRHRNVVDAVQVNGVRRSGGVPVVDDDRVALPYHKGRSRDDPVVGVGHYRKT